MASRREHWVCANKTTTFLLLSANTDSISLPNVLCHCTCFLAISCYAMLHAATLPPTLKTSCPSTDPSVICLPACLPVHPPSLNRSPSSRHRAAPVLPSTPTPTADHRPPTVPSAYRHAEPTTAHLPLRGGASDDANAAAAAASRPSASTRILPSPPVAVVLLPALATRLPKRRSVGRECVRACVRRGVTGRRLRAVSDREMSDLAAAALARPERGEDDPIMLLAGVGGMETGAG
ncbi:hypothetical protein IWX46DRAFT_222048 [Phyllosticta citricarpa]|uniref:Uncharacterized protein n=1 Tax=Phyllosticta citricarpa TaxID=55181 RepID=A0ABR1MNN0_9PEZI